LRAANEREKRECLKTKQRNFKDRYFTFVSSHLGLTGSSDPSLRFGISEKRPISQQETRNHTFSHEDGVAFARWSITCLLFALAAGVMAFNKMTVCSWMRRKNPAATISIVGGFLGAAGCLLSPAPWLNKAWWLPSLLDIAGLPYLLGFVWIGIERCLKRLREAISN
jgi:hypothetical protein